MIQKLDDKKPTTCNYSIIGQMHNDGLDKIYAYFKNDTVWKELSMMQSLDSLVLSERTDNNSNLSSPHWPLKETDAILIVNTKKANLSQFMSNKPKIIRPILLNNGLSTENYDLLLEVRNLLYLNYNSFDELLIAIEEKENQITLDGKMSYFIEEPINILKASICYWGQSYEKWSEISTSTVQLRWCGHDWDWFWDSVNDMAEDDFWSGALGAVIGDGEGAVAGAMYGSAASGIAHLFDGC